MRVEHRPNRSHPLLATVLLLAACGVAPRYNEVLALYGRGQYEEVDRRCAAHVADGERELSDERRARLKEAQQRYTTAMDDEEILIPDGLRVPEDEPSPRENVTRTLTHDAPALRPGDGLRALANDLLSDSPTRVLRATNEVEQLGLSRLAPHCIMRIFERVALSPDRTGPFSELDLETLHLLVRRRCAAAVHAVIRNVNR